jgi:hypothetical protein
MLPQTIANQVDSALPSVGITPTKGGAGEKEKAYIVQTNACLKITFVVIAIVVVLLLVLSQTVLQVRVYHRATVKEQSMLRKEQHKIHREVIHKTLELQQLIKKEIEDYDHIRVTRARMSEELKAYMTNVSVALQAEKDFQEKEKDKFQDIVWEWRNSTQLFAKKLKDILNLISKQAKKDRDRANQWMHDALSDIDREERLDAGEEVEYEHAMAGEDTKMYDDEAKKEDEAAGSNMDKELTLFFKQVDTVAALKLTVPQMSRIETVWENEVQQKMLEVDSEENSVDMHELDAKMLSAAEPAKTIFPYIPEKHGKVIDYFNSLIDIVGAVKKMSELQGLKNKWHDHRLGNMAVVAKLEKLHADTPAFPIHWLWNDYLSSKEGGAFTL